MLENIWLYRCGLDGLSATQSAFLISRHTEREFRSPHLKFSFGSRRRQSGRRVEVAPYMSSLAGGRYQAGHLHHVLHPLN